MVSQVKTRQSKIYKFKKFPNIQILEFCKKHCTKHTFWSCLIRCIDMKWIQQVFSKIQSGYDSIHRQTDRQMDGWRETSIPLFQLCILRGIYTSIAGGKSDTTETIECFYTCAGAGWESPQHCEQMVPALIFTVVTPKPRDPFLTTSSGTAWEHHICMHRRKQWIHVITLHHCPAIAHTGVKALIGFTEIHHDFLENNIQ